jgi:divalent metal cation (Fe/Co/Zn/Cd) transporter
MPLHLIPHLRTTTRSLLLSVLVIMVNQFFGNQTVHDSLGMLAPWLPVLVDSLRSGLTLIAASITAQSAIRLRIGNYPQLTNGPSSGS